MLGHRLAEHDEPGALRQATERVRERAVPLHALHQLMVLRVLRGASARREGEAQQQPEVVRVVCLHAVPR